MKITDIHLSIPFMGEGEQTRASFITRCTAVALGAIAIAAGLALALNATTLSAIGTVGCTFSITAGSIALLGALVVRCVKQIEQASQGRLAEPDFHAAGNEDIPLTPQGPLVMAGYRADGKYPVESERYEYTRDLYTSIKVHHSKAINIQDLLNPANHAVAPLGQEIFRGIERATAHAWIQAMVNERGLRTYLSFPSTCQGTFLPLTGSEIKSTANAIRTLGLTDEALLECYVDELNNDFLVSRVLMLGDSVPASDYAPGTLGHFLTTTDRNERYKAAVLRATLPFSKPRLQAEIMRVVTHSKTEDAHIPIRSLSEMVQEIQDKHLSGFSETQWLSWLDQSDQQYGKVVRLMLRAYPNHAAINWEKALKNPADILPYSFSFEDQCDIITQFNPQTLVTIIEILKGKPSSPLSFRHKSKWYFLHYLTLKQIEHESVWKALPKEAYRDMLEGRYAKIEEITNHVPEQFRFLVSSFTGRM